MQGKWLFILLAVFIFGISLGWALEYRGIFKGISQGIKNTFFNSKFFSPAAIVQPTQESTNKEKENFQQFEETKTFQEDSGIKKEKDSLQKSQEQLNELAERVENLSKQEKLLKKEKIEPRKKEKEEINEKTKKEKIKETCQLRSININTAPLSELEKIVGIGPAIAQRIIEKRPFSSLTDLLKVKGIGQKTLQKIIEQGCAFVENSYNPKPETKTGSKSELSSKPTISLSFPSENPVNKEIEIILSLSNLKNASYDLKISILKISNESEQKRTISEIYNQNENKWQSSYNYLLNFFSGTSFSGNFKLKIKEQNFRGQAEIIAKIRENGKSNVYLEHKEKINITDPQFGQNQPPIASFVFFPKISFVGDKIIFDASSSTDDGVVTNYIWNFGDGNSTTTNLPIIVHKYQQSGDFTVNLLVTDNQGAVSLSTSTNIKINSMPTFSVVINEIAWMGTINSSWDEWIELYNNSSSSINLAGWKIKKNGEDFIKISTSTTISAYNFYLLERTEKATDILADFIYSGNKLMKNDSCEILSLYDQVGNLVDQTACFTKNWPGGKAKPDYLSMERIDPTKAGFDSTNWASNNKITKNGKDAGGNSINGTPKSENSVSKSQSIYLCPNATSTQTIYPNCSGRINLQLGENPGGIFVSIVEKDGKEYYAISGFKNGGGGVNLKPQVSLSDFYLGKVGQPSILTASTTDPNEDPLEYRWDFDFDGKWDLVTVSPTIEYTWNKEYTGFILLEVSDGEFVTRTKTFIKIQK